MAKNETGIAITIKAWLPTGKTLDEQYAALTVVKTAHESGDYAPLLGAAKIEAVLTDSKTRRVEEAPEPVTSEAVTEDNVRKGVEEIKATLAAADDDLDPQQDPEAHEADTHPMTEALKADRKSKAA